MGREYNTGRDAWDHGQPDWSLGRTWDQRPFHVFLGPCPRCGSRTFDYGGGWACVGLYCQHSVGSIVCSNPPRPDWWETIDVALDGNAWCATDAATFINLAESEAGFGDTPQAAVDDLRKRRPGGAAPDGRGGAK